MRAIKSKRRRWIKLGQDRSRIIEAVWSGAQRTDFNFIHRCITKCVKFYSNTVWSSGIPHTRSTCSQGGGAAILNDKSQAVCFLAGRIGRYFKLESRVETLGYRLHWTPRCTNLV